MKTGNFGFQNLFRRLRWKHAAVAVLYFSIQHCSWANRDNIRRDVSEYIFLACTNLNLILYYRPLHAGQIKKTWSVSKKLLHLIYYSGWTIRSKTIFYSSSKGNFLDDDDIIKAITALIGLYSLATWKTLHFDKLLFFDI